MKRTLIVFQKLIFTSTFSLFLFLCNVQAQLLQTVDATANGPYTPQSLISNVLLGSGVEVSNITYNGRPEAVGYFSGGTQAIGIERGILLTTGFAGKPANPQMFGPTNNSSFEATNNNLSTAGDVTLAGIASSSIYNVAVYTITFVPTSDTLRFRYCFASEEYPEWSCTDFNDIFGFFIQGPGYPLPTNIAKIPNTNLPVSINNIHPVNNMNNPNPDPCPAFNAQYYNATVANQQPVYDGFTDVFTAVAVVTPCQSYTIKLAIADVFDEYYDSGVFLEAKSFSTTSLRVAVNTPSADGSIAEGCTPASITFSLADPLTYDYPINMNISGSASPGIDFQNLPGNLLIPAGQTEITYPLSAMEDNLAEGLETIAFDVQIDICHRDTFYLQIRDNQLLPLTMQDVTNCTPGTAVLLDATVAVPTPPAPSFSNTQDLNIQDNNIAASSNINVSGVQPANLGPEVIRSVCVNVAHNDDGDLDLYLVSPGGQVLELSTDNGGTGNNYTNTCFTPDAASAIIFPGPQAPATAAPFTGNFLPEGAWSDLWDTPARPTNGTWKLKANDDFASAPPSIGTLLDWSITFAPSYEVIYAWAASPDITCLSCPTASVAPAVSSTYSVTATDTYGCSVTDDVHVEVMNMLINTGVTNPVSCFGLSDGIASATVNLSGANTYLWSDAAGQTNADAVNLAAGTYTVTVSNPGGCTGTASISLSEPSQLELSGSAQDVQCFGQNSGSVSTQVNGGTLPYQYAWSNVLNTPNIPSLSAGAFTLTLTDGNGCTVIESYTIIEPAELLVNTSTLKQVSCFGAADGEINLSYTGGVEPVTFLWNTGQSGQSISALIAGNYTVTTTDANGCSRILQQSISEPADLAAFAAPKAVKCHGESNGELHLDVSGGSPVYQINWQGPNGFTASGVDLTNLAAGNYSATLTDQNGCSETVSSVVPEPSAILLALPAIADTICFSASNGTVTVVPSGGTPPYSYVWDANGQTGATATGLASQEYHLTVTDANGCVETGKTIVPQKYELNTFAQPTLPLCHDGIDGSATVLSIFYGVTPADPNTFQYTWNTVPVQNSITANNLKADQAYSVTITDPDGCTAQHAFIMGNPLSVEAAITGSGNVLCHGESSGWASANAFGGTTPYSWLWGAGTTPTDSVGQGLSAGVHRVTITDAHGCPDIMTVSIAEPPALQAQILPVDVKCFGESTGSAKVIASGGTSPYAYIWWNGAQTAEIGQLEAGLVGLTVSDGNGCSMPVTMEITQPALPVSGTADMREPRCFGDHNGQILITPEGGTPPYRYALDNKPFNGSSIQIGLTAGNYLPRIMDKNGCIADLMHIEVTQKDQFQLDLGPDIRILLGQDTQLLAQIINATGNYSLFWSQADSSWLSCLDCSNPSVYSLTYNHYFEASAIDSIGCRASDQIQVIVEKPRKVFVPTAFSPNGDFNNDRLLVHGQQNSKVLVFRVFDRWGEMVFEGKDFPFNDENNGWDGTFRDQPMDPGVYVWVLEVQYVDGVTEMYKGNTTLVR